MEGIYSLLEISAFLEIGLFLLRSGCHFHCRVGVKDEYREKNFLFLDR